ncbi:MAG: hypothetical protein IIC50_24320, partial [Planctomycetes bacterium]|nr:hypothetical protein [Planctomycetota bacterium]
MNLPWDPDDPNCLLIPQTANVDTAFAAINSSILPEIDAILAELDGVPNTLQISLDPSLTGLLDDLEIDGGDKLALVAALLGVKAVLSGAANPAYNILVDLSHSLFTGWECGDLPETTTLKAILAQYPDLLKILPGGAANLAQSKANLLATLNAFFAATDHILAETDDQTDDLLSILNADNIDVPFTELAKLRDALTNDTSAIFNVGSTHTYNLMQNSNQAGTLTLVYDPSGESGEGGSLTFTDPDLAPVPVPHWHIDWFDVSGTMLEVFLESPDFWYWGWLTGTIASDGSSISNMTFNYSGASQGQVAGLSAQRTDTSQHTLEINLNPLFAGSVAPRDFLPQLLDPDDEPVPGTFGHGLGDDATLGGVLPNMTQADWMPSGYEVWGGNVALSTQQGSGLQNYYHIDHQGYTKLGESDGRTLTVSGSDYLYYVIAARGEFQLDAIVGSDNTSYSGDLITGDTRNRENILGPPDNQYASVGFNGFSSALLTTLLDEDNVVGFVVIENPEAWTGLTVFTDEGAVNVSVEANPDSVVADGTSFSTITITVTDENSNPEVGIPAADIQVVGTDGTDFIITQPSSATDASGQTTATIASNTAGQTVTVTGTVFGVSDSDTVVFTTGPGAKLTFTGQPEGPYDASQIINAVPEVTVQDAQGRTVTTSNANINVTSNPSTTVSGHTTRQANQGVATFDDLSIDRAGTYTFTATSTGLTSATSAEFIVGPQGSSARLNVLTHPGTTPAEAILTPHLRVAVVDVFGNRITSPSRAITVSILNTGNQLATLEGTIEVTTGDDDGVATFDDLKIVDFEGIGFQL